MAGRLNRIRKALLFLAVLAGAVQISGCGLAAAALIARDTPFSEKRALLAQVLGYQAFMEVHYGDSETSEVPCGRISEFGTGNCLQVYDLNVVHTPEFSIAEVRLGLNLDRYSGEKSGKLSGNLSTDLKAGPLPESGTVIRIFVFPGQDIYAFQGRTLDSRGRKTAEQGFSAKDSGVLFGGLGDALGQPWPGIFDYLAGVRASECSPVSFREEQDFRLLAECGFRAAGHSGKYLYRAAEWTSFDRGLFFPKEFLVTSDSGERVTVRVRGARELFREQRERGIAALDEVAREISERVSRGELPQAGSTAEVRALVRDL